MEKIFTYLQKLLPKNPKQKKILGCIALNSIVFLALGHLLNQFVGTFPNLSLTGLIFLSFGLGFYNSFVIKELNKEAFIGLFIIQIVSASCLALPLLLNENAFVASLIPTTIFGIIPHFSLLLLKEYETVPEYVPITAVPDYQSVSGLPLFAATNDFIEFVLVDQSTKETLTSIGLSVNVDAVFQCSIAQVFAAFVQYQNYTANTEGQVETSVQPSIEEAETYAFSYYTKTIFGFQKWLDPEKNLRQNRLTLKAAKRATNEPIRKIKIFAIRQPFTN